MSATAIERTQGDSSPWGEDTLLDANGDPINLTGSTVKFTVSQRGQTPVLNKVSCSVSSPATAGKVTPTPTGVQSAAIAAGTYMGEYEITYADSTVQTAPTSRTKIPVIIHAQLA